MADVVKKIEVSDIEIISAKIQQRQTRFLHESLDMSIAVVLVNFGEGYVEVSCVNGEWSGIKNDLESRDGAPLCPNGHVMVETSKAPVLALVKEQ